MGENLEGKYRGSSLRRGGRGSIAKSILSFIRREERSTYSYRDSRRTGEKRKGSQSVQEEGGLKAITKSSKRLQTTSVTGRGGANISILRGGGTFIPKEPLSSYTLPNPEEGGQAGFSAKKGRCYEPLQNGGRNTSLLKRKGKKTGPIFAERKPVAPFGDLFKRDLSFDGEKRKRRLNS